MLELVFQLPGLPDREGAYELDTGRSSGFTKRSRATVAGQRRTFLVGLPVFPYYAPCFRA